jgi:hypothetical protein
LEREDLGHNPRLLLSLCGSAAPLRCADAGRNDEYRGGKQDRRPIHHRCTWQQPGEHYCA